MKETESLSHNTSDGRRDCRSDHRIRGSGFVEMTDMEPPQRKRKVEEDEGRCVKDYTPSTKIVSVDKPYRPPSGWSDDDEIDPALEEEYYRRIRESQGFDIGDLYIPNGLLRRTIYDVKELEIELCARLGLHCFNFQKGTNLQLADIYQYNTQFCSLCTYFITLKAVDLADQMHHTFQACVTRATLQNNEDLRLRTEACRFKPTTHDSRNENWRWDYGAIDDFYRGDLPDWLSSDALTGGDKEQYYEVQESDLRENDWIHLYSELAFFSVWEGNEPKFSSSMPLEIKKVAVQTREAVETQMKLKASNAIFYISFRDKKGPGGSWVDYRAIVRRTTDGKAGHVCLEIQCWRDN